MLVFAIAVLAHCPQFSDPKNIEQLLLMKSCLWFVMEPLITKNDSYCYSFYKGMLDRIKTVKDAITPDDEISNEVCGFCNFFICSGCYRNHECMRKFVFIVTYLSRISI